MDDNRKRPETNQNNATRKIPVKPENAQTRQIPVQRSKESGDNTRRIPASSTRGSTHADTDNNAKTRQIPVQRNNVSLKGTSRPAAPVNQIKQPLPQDDLAETKKMNTPKSAADIRRPDNNGTKIMKNPTGDNLIPKKKRRISDNSEDISDGSTVVSIVKAVVYIVSVLVVSIAISVFIILVGNDVYAFVKSDETVEVTIPEGADINDIASILSDSQIIKYPGIFKMYAGHNNDDGKFVAGKYSISANMDYDDLLSAFKEKVPEGTSWVTIPEGYTTDEIIDLLVESGIGTKEGYIDVINNYAFDYWFVQELDQMDWKETGRYYRLDGYLFPDTYEFYNNSSEKTVINKLLARFNVIYSDKYKEAAAAMNMTTDEIITIASMIEKEAGKAADYHLVSSVFHNRLQSEYFPKMESDATILYAIHHDTGERPNTVTHDDLQYQSPYNTYLYDGLPPGPIANPSASSINAALTPENTNYYYFVSYDINTYFARTKEEHDNNIAMINELRSKANG